MEEAHVTDKSISSQPINLTIDGKAVQAHAGQTILETARQNGIVIPTLCYHPRLLPIGSCRLCVVEIEGAERPMTACTTPAQEGIVVRTQTEQLNAMRRAALELILTYHAPDCPQCDAGGACELQNLVVAFGIDTQPYRAERKPQGMREFATPLIRQWRDRCVMCLRCIRADHEIVRTRAIDLAGTGIDAEVGIINRDACISCGECLQVCPVGALTEHVSRVKARPWQSRKVITTCFYCSLGCQMELTCFEDTIVAATGVNQGSLCQRGIFGYDVFNHAARVTTPLIKRAAQWQDASWEEALGVIAEKLRDVLQKDGPAAVGGLISPRATNEEIFLFQRFLREVVGTNHIDSTGRLCLEPYRAAMQEITGSDGLPVRLDAIAASDCIVIAGGDLDTDNHLIAANAVRTALWQNGARLIVLHPFKGRLAREADCWFPLLPGEEGIWVRGMIHHLLERHLEGPEAAQKIRGFAELKEAAKGFTLDRTAQEIGCTPELLQEAARHLAQARQPVFLGSPPLGQGPNGVDQIKALANLALLCNAFAAGGGLHCVHFVGPQSNMAGAEEMGASPFVLPGNLPPAEKGLSAVEQFQAAAAGRLKAMFVIGEDPFLTLPQGIVTQGVAQLELLAVQDLFLSETAHHAHVFLPALPWTTQNGTFTSYEGRVQRLRQAAAISTSDKSRQLGEVLTGLAALLGKEFSALSPAAVFSEITQRHPLYAGLSFEPTTPQWRGAGQEAPMDKAAFSTFGAEPAKRQEGYPFALSLEGIFESHLIGETQEQRAQGLAQVSRSYLAINAEEARAIGLVDTGRCRIITPWGETAAPVKTFPEQRRGSLVYVLSFSDPAASQLLGPELDPRSLAPAYAGIPARVEKA